MSKGATVSCGLHTTRIDLTAQWYASLQLRDDDRPREDHPDNDWLWPSAVLVDSFSYSDGSIFPQAYQDRKLGNDIFLFLPSFSDSFS